MTHGITKKESAHKGGAKDLFAEKHCADIEVKIIRANQNPLRCSQLAFKCRLKKSLVADNFMPSAQYIALGIGLPINSP